MPTVHLGRRSADLGGPGGDLDGLSADLGDLSADLDVLDGGLAGTVPGTWISATGALRAPLLPRCPL